MEATSLAGRIVRSAETGVAVGRVEELLFDPAQHRLWALRTRFQDEVRLVPLSAIRAFARDAVIVPDPAELPEAPTSPAHGQAIALRSLLGASVTTADGRRLGRVAEIEVYPANGRITAITLACGGCFGVGVRVQSVAAERILCIARGAVVVDGPTAPEPALPHT